MGSEVESMVLPPSRWSPEFRLSDTVRKVATVINLGVGVFPGYLIFFGWIERNCTLPGVANLLDLPWVNFSELHLLFKCGWNIFLFLLFGLIHSFLAQKPIQAVMERWIPPQLIRTVFICISGLTLMGVIVLWQPTGVWLWRFPFEPTINMALSMVIYWGLVFSAAGQLTWFGAVEFVGIRQLGMAVNEIHRTEGTPQLVVTGLYRWVRHPVYAIVLLASLLAPEMALDRVLVFGSTLVYLLFGIPMEERKLIRLFGKSYLEYRDQVPALIPFSKLG